MVSTSWVYLVLLAALTGCLADNSHGRFWDYFSQLTSEKEQWHLETPEREASGLKTGIQNGVNYVGNFLGPIKNGVQQRLYEDTDGLRKLIRRELQELRRKLYPYMDEAHQKISGNLEQLKKRLIPFTEELMGQVRWAAQELQLNLGPHDNEMKDVALHSLADKFQDRINLHTAKIQQILYPLAERLLAEIHHAAEELRGNLVPHPHTTQEKLNQQVLELSRKLSKNARELHQKIDRNLNELKEQLVSYPLALKKTFSVDQEVEPVAPYVEEMAAQVQREVEEFHRSTQLQIEDFARSINREAEEMHHRLSPASWDFQDNTSSVENVQEKLDSLWRDISQSMN
ncbi:apolipoprotein A-V isoform 2-T2 [Discoglossus pictus]